MTDLTPTLLLERDAAREIHLDPFSAREYVGLINGVFGWPQDLPNPDPEVRPLRGHTQASSPIQAAYLYGTLEHVTAHALKHVRNVLDAKLTVLAKRQEGYASRLYELAQLGEDWDSYGALPPSTSAIATANLFIQRQALESVTNKRPFKGPWAIVPVPDGGIQFHWRDAHREIELEILPSGGLEYYVEVDGQVIAETDEDDPKSLDDALAVVTRGLS